MSQVRGTRISPEDGRAKSRRSLRRCHIQITPPPFLTLFPSLLSPPVHSLSEYLRAVYRSQRPSFHALPGPLAEFAALILSRAARETAAPAAMAAVTMTMEMVMEVKVFEAMVDVMIESTIARATVRPVKHVCSPKRRLSGSS